VGEANVRAIQSYRPQPVRADVHLFMPTAKGGLAEIARRKIPDEGDHGWSAKVGQSLELHEAPGSHFTMITGEGAAEIARALRTLVDRPHTACVPQPGPEHAPLGR
jgi:thioesterase domain-containing protein